MQASEGSRDPGAHPTLAATPTEPQAGLSEIVTQPVNSNATRCLPTVAVFEEAAAERMR
jgi:hypothetical protein